MSMIRVSNLTKKYKAVTAVADFSFDVGRGELVAVVGPDGAGKTSLFRSICGLIHFDAGEILIGEHDAVAHFDKIKPLLGYMPQTFSLYPDLSVEENLRFYAGLFGLGKDEFNGRKDRLYEFSGLGPFHDRRVINLSGGMKQKLALSCNLIHNPKILVLDEPTTGVDPLSRRQFWDILKKLRLEGASILVSTPYMDEVELAGRAIFIHHGRKLAEGTPEELTERYVGRVYRLEVEPTSRQMRNLGEIENIDARRFGATVHVYVSEATTEDDLAGKLGGAGIDASQVEEISPELEDVFIQLMGQGN